MRILLFVLAATAVLLAAAHALGWLRWHAGTRELRARLESARLPAPMQRVDFTALHDVPAPVARYLRSVLEEAQPLVTAVRIEHEGSFNMDEQRDAWKPFVSEQRVTTQPPGFDWNARIEAAPLLPARVHDAYVGGEGVLSAALLGLVPLVDLRGGGEIARGELMRYFAESAWYPTALLPGPHLTWEAVDDQAARATLRDGALTLSLLFLFDDAGLISVVRADARGRTLNGKIVPTPWEGRFWNYQRHGGMLVPTEGEVSWLPPEGRKPYWRGRVTRIEYEFAR